MGAGVALGLCVFFSGHTGGLPATELAAAGGSLSDWRLALQALGMDDALAELYLEALTAAADLPPA